MSAKRYDRGACLALLAILAMAIAAAVSGAPEFGRKAAFEALEGGK